MPLQAAEQNRRVKFCYTSLRPMILRISTNIFRSAQTVLRAASRCGTKSVQRLSLRVKFGLPHANDTSMP
ncbi:MAG: hypothetical protein LBG96_14040 [Tannerella sp.]|nr:hypothetical protein [Tannerella sp.]